MQVPVTHHSLDFTFGPKQVGGCVAAGAHRRRRADEATHPAQVVLPHRPQLEPRRQLRAQRHTAATHAPPALTSKVGAIAGEG